MRCGGNISALTRRRFAVGAAALGAAGCGSRMTAAAPLPPAIIVDEPRALVDLPVKIELRDFAPDTPAANCGMRALWSARQFPCRIRGPILLVSGPTIRCGRRRTWRTW
jgi:hypothetical protein